MPQIEVTLPSGAKGRVRGLKGRELNLFANRAAAKQSKTGTQILTNVWEETIDPGPLYSEKIDWELAPQCDRFVALFYARIATYSSEFAFKHRCSSCGKQYEWVEDLSLRPVKPMPAASIEAFKNGNRFTTEVMTATGDSLKVVFQLLTPKLEGKIDQVQSLAPSEKATIALAQRIVSVEGLEEGKGPINRFLMDLDAGTMFELIACMDDVDGGIETEVEVTCNHCGELEVLELPFGLEFWTPPKRRGSTRTTTT